MLYSDEMVILLQQLRSRIYTEFGVRIRLVDPDLLDSLAAMGSRSRDQFTRVTISRVLELAGIGRESDAGAGEPEGPVMTYRGNRVYTEKSSAPEEAVEKPRKATKQMYRGQLVYK